MKIEAKNLIKIYGDRSVVNDVSFEINKGEVVCLLGPNGAGKTTTFYMVVGLVKPNGGSIMLNGQDISEWPMNIRAKAGIGYLPQEASIFRKLTVEENIKLVLQMNDKLTECEKKHKLEELLSEFGILRLIVTNPIEVKEKLEENDFIVKITKVLAVSIRDEPGGLNTILRLLNDNDINLEYLYAFVEQKTYNAIVLLRLENMDEGLKILKEGNANIISSDEIYSM